MADSVEQASIKSTEADMLLAQISSKSAEAEETTTEEDTATEVIEES